MTDDKATSMREAALYFHEFPKPGKLEIVATKPLANTRDLSLAYSPGVAIPCEEIAANPADAYKYTSKGNLVAVVSNGTAVRYPFTVQSLEANGAAFNVVVAPLI